MALFGTQRLLKLLIQRSVFYSRIITLFWVLQQLITSKMILLSDSANDLLLHQLTLELYGLFSEMSHSNTSISLALLMITIII
jgi:hypothetical protein